MIYRITHVNTYRYSEPVTLCHNLAHLSARDAATDVLTVADLYSAVAGGAVVAQRFFRQPDDLFLGPRAAPEPHGDGDQPDTTSSGAGARPRVHAVLGRCAGPLARPGSAEDIEASPFRFDSEYVERHPDLAAYARPSFAPGRPILDAVLDFTRRIHAEFRYDKTATTTATPVLEVLRHRHGVCQDFAHLQIGGLRSLGLAARYVSGYLLTMPPPGQARLLGADASHAWVSFYCPGFGWIDVDPTNNLMPTDKHITFAWGRDYDDVCPLKGVILGGGKQEVEVGVSVVPVETGEIDEG